MEVVRAELSVEKSQHDSLKRLYEQQSKQQQDKIDHVQQENVWFRQKAQQDKEAIESQSQRIQSQLDGKDATILQLEVSRKLLLMLAHAVLGLQIEFSAGIIDQLAATS